MNKLPTDFNKQTSSPLSKFFIVLILLQGVVYNPWGNDVFTLPKTVFLQVLTLTTFLVWLVRQIEIKTISIKKTYLDLPLLIYFLLAIISTIFSIYPPASRQELSRLLCFLVVFYLIINIFKKREISFIIIPLFLSAFLVSVYACLQRMGIDFVSWMDKSVFLRPSSTLGNPNFLSAYLCIILPLPIVYYLNLWYLNAVHRAITSCESRNLAGTTTSDGIRWIWFKIIVLYILILLIFISLLFTFARAGWLSFLISFILLLLFLDNEKTKEARVGLAVLILSFIFISGIFSNIKIPIEGRQMDVVERATSFSPSVFVRLNLWKDALHLSREKIILGGGLDAFPFFYPRHRSVEILRIQAVTALPENAHNNFLQIASCQGILGLFAFLWIVLAFLKKMGGRIFSLNFLSSGIIASFTAFIVQSMFNPITPDTHLLLFIILSLSVLDKGEDEDRYYSLTLPFKDKFRTIISLIMAIDLLLILLPKVITPYLADLHYRKAQDAYHQGLFEEAVKRYYSAISLDPKNEKYHRQIALVLKRVGEISRQKKFFKEAVKEYKEVIRLNPWDGSAYSDLGGIYGLYAQIFDEKYYPKAEKEYKKALELDPNYAIFHNDLGIVYLNWGKIKEAEKEFKVALKLVPNFPDPYLNLGILYYRQKELRRAIEFTRKAEVLSPQNPEVFANLGLYFRKMKNYEEAIKNIKKAINLNPQDRSLRSLLTETIDFFENSTKKGEGKR